MDRVRFKVTVRFESRVRVRFGLKVRVRFGLRVRIGFGLRVRMGLGFGIGWGQITLGEPFGQRLIVTSFILAEILPFHPKLHQSLHTQYIFPPLAPNPLLTPLATLTKAGQL